MKVGCDTPSKEGWLTLSDMAVVRIEIRKIEGDNTERNGTVRTCQKTLPYCVRVARI